MPTVFAVVHVWPGIWFDVCEKAKHHNRRWWNIICEIISCEEQGLSLFPDGDMYTCPLFTMALATCLHGRYVDLPKPWRALIDLINDPREELQNAPAPSTNTHLIQQFILI